MPEYKVKIVKRIFYAEDSGYGVFRVTFKGAAGGTTLVGNLLDVAEGDFLHVEGEEFMHPRFGKQLKVQQYQVILPDDSEGMIKYLSSGRIPGIGKVTAERIVKKFGHSVFEILEKEPERLKEVKGVKKKIIEEIKKNSQANQTIRELTVRLSPHGIGRETIVKIYKTFGDSVIDLLEVNPYILIDQVRGVGFRIADTIGRGFGLEKDDRHRIKAGIDYYLEQIEQQDGDLYIEEEQLVTKASKLLDVPAATIETMVTDMVQGGQLICEDVPPRVLVNLKNYHIEKAAARKLAGLSQGGSLFKQESIPVDFSVISKRIAVELTPEQSEAVVSAVNNPLTVITGGPGTGKTTIIRAIIEALKLSDKKVSVAAPTGRAAKRIDEATHYQASTIHRMLKIDPETRQFVYNEKKPLEADAIIVDEFSMVDTYLFYSLLKAVSQQSRLIIIGDKDQLPSVGPGNVLRDIINSGYFNVISLSRNFRQEKDSLIISNAYHINNGEELEFKAYSEDLDFVLVKVDNEEMARDKVLRIIEYYKNDISYNSPDFQVLVPMYRGEAGIDSLNRRVQEQFNPSKQFTVNNKYTYKIGDKVMQLRNNYEKEIFNGEQGIITSYKPANKSLCIDFDGNIKEYNAEELEEITLSYAMSVHKSQGSEYHMLILVLLPSHAIMLNRELFYTAATRARKKLFLVSDLYTIRRAIANSSPSERKTLLPRRLQEIFEPGVGA